MIWIDSLVTTDQGAVRLRDLTPKHRIVSTRGYIPVHTVLIPDEKTVLENAPVVVLFTKRTRTESTAITVTVDHPILVVRPNDHKPVLVRADDVRETDSLVTLTKYHRVSLLPLLRLATATAAVGNVYVDDPAVASQYLAHNLMVSGGVVGFDTSKDNLVLLQSCVAREPA